MKLNSEYQLKEKDSKNFCKVHAKKKATKQGKTVKRVGREHVRVCEVVFKNALFIAIPGLGALRRLKQLITW